MTQSLTISRLARDAGVGIDTVRYYERNGLLPEPQRRASGYRIYREEDLKRLRFIRRAKTLGFTLDEIRDLLELSEQNERGVAGVKASAEAKLHLVDERIAELQRMRAGLQDLVDACPGHGSTAHCPILNTLTGQDETPESPRHAR